MKLSKMGMLALTLAGSFSATPALSRDMLDTLLDNLRSSGFTSIEINSTLLGRTRITAESRNAWREIVIDPRTGEILRDYWQDIEGSGDSSSSGSSNDDDDGEDDDDSHSGSGSGGSGSGSGGSGSGSGGSGSGGSGSGGGGSGSDDG